MSTNDIAVIVLTIGELLIAGMVIGISVYIKKHSKVS